MMQEQINKILPAVAIRLEGEIMLAAPVDTARLKNSIRVIVTPTGLMISMVDYGEHVEFGTAPHVIRPKNKKALAFAKSGGKRVMRKGKVKTKFKFGGKTVITGAVFAKKVMHPGTAPNPFIRDTLNRKLGLIIQEELSKL